MTSVSLSQLVTAFGFPFSRNFSNGYRIIWSFFPPNLFAEALKQLSRATETPADSGISWSRRTKCAPHDGGCLITIVRPLIFLSSSNFFFLKALVWKAKEERERKFENPSCTFLTS